MIGVAVSTSQSGFLNGIIVRYNNGEQGKFHFVKPIVDYVQLDDKNYINLTPEPKYAF